MAPARAVGDLLNPVVDAGDCRVRYSDAFGKTKPLFDLNGIFSITLCISTPIVLHMISDRLKLFSVC